ncbi:MAG: cysteine desulfurase-like protein [Longimicrobiales bacterium]
MALATVEAIRSHFPALRRTHGGHVAAFFDGPGGTQVPDPVPVAMADYLFHRNANAHWAFPTSAETDRVRHQAREAMADFLGGDADEMVFGPNMTTLTYHLSRALGRGMAPGDEIVVTELDHHANVDPWKALEVERGVVVKVLPLIPDSGTLDLQEFPRLLSPRTKLVALGAASNALGTLTEISPLARMARTAGARVFVDAVHLAPHRRIDVRSMECDFLACSPYKFYGPHAGVLWIRRELLAELDIPKVAPAPDAGPERFESGTVNAEGMAGTTAAVEFLASLAKGDAKPGPDAALTRSARLDAVFSGLMLREEALLRRLWDGLSGIPGVRTYGPPPGPDRAPTLSFTVGSIPARAVSSRLADGVGAFLSHGSFYAATVVDRLGVRDQGLVRAGISIYNTEEEVDRLVGGLAEVARGR